MSNTDAKKPVELDAEQNTRNGNTITMEQVL